MQDSTDFAERQEARFGRLADSLRGTAAEHLPLVIWQDRVNRDSPRILYRHHDFLSLYIVRQGSGTHVIDGTAYGVARGDVYAMGQGMAHYFAECDSLILDTLHFAPHIFDPPTLDALSRTPGFQSLFVEEPLHRAEAHGGGGRWLHLTPDAYAQVAAEIAELRTEWESGTPSGTLLVRGLFVRLLVHLARWYAPHQEQKAADGRGTASSVLHEATVASAVRYLDAHFMEPVRIEQVAAAVFLSPDRFTEVFAAVMGRTPRDYLRHLRLERAKLLLARTEDPIAEVGVQSGFGEAAYFTRAFRAATGMTPSEFRRR